jgi:2-polyprenyl-6-methoxyphenol hydroxylase-like FAD-dependent oxidoreductase
VGRTELTQLLYDSLPSDRQACMLPNKKVANIATTSDGVVVSCADGTSYEGSIIIGADGAHSIIRSRMRELALQAAPAASTSVVNEETPYLTTYQALWVRFPTSLGLTEGEVSETHGKGLATQLFAGEDTTVVALYERLETPTRERSRYTSADEEALVKRWAHVPISKKLAVKDAYDARVESGMVQLEEGVVEHWSWDRVVLVGDAAHKFTPSTGQGCNNGIIDVVVLMNELHKAVEDARARGPGAAPSKDELTTVFKNYQDARYEQVSQGCKMSGNATATATWENSACKFIDRWVLSSHMLQKFMINRGAAIVAQSPVLDFVAGEEQLVGKTPWVHPMKPISVRAN